MVGNGNWFKYRIVATLRAEVLRPRAAFYGQGPEDFTEGSRSQTLCTSQTETSTGVARSYLACIITFVEAFYANVGCNLPYLTCPQVSVTPHQCSHETEGSRVPQTRYTEQKTIK